jgi:hypothetical protein
LVREKNNEKQSHQLFNLEKDPSEKTNVAAEFPEERKRLVALLDSILKERTRRP